jgi:hypothetical protein
MITTYRINNVNLSGSIRPFAELLVLLKDESRFKIDEGGSEVLKSMESCDWKKKNSFGEEKPPPKQTKFYIIRSFLLKHEKSLLIELQKLNDINEILAEFCRKYQKKNQNNL